MELTTIEQIKKAVDEGKTVYAENESYQVVKDTHNQYMIKCENYHYVGLHGMEGTEYENVLNANKFFTKE
jgi:hypothetical protein